jgi:hypothetical protein
MPGIGTFGVEQIPATMDFENKKLNPPTQNIKLESYEIATDTYSFYNFLAKELNVNESEAARRFKEFTHDVEKQTAATGSLLLPGIGKLRKDYSGYVIDAEVDTKQVLPDLWITKTQAATTTLMDVYANVQPSIIKRTNFEENVDKLVVAEKEDYWWVIAIVLAIMGLASLLYYYI